MKRIALSALAVLLPVLAQAAPTDPLSAAFAASYAHEAKQDLPGAIKALKEVESSRGDVYVLNLRLAWLSYNAGLWNESAAYYERSAELAPSAVEPLQGLLLPLAAAGKTQELIKTHERILQLDPANYKSLSGLAWAYYLRKDYAQAVTYYTRVVKLYPSDVEMLIGLAASLKADGALARSRSYYRLANLLSPSDKRAIEGMK